MISKKLTRSIAVGAAAVAVAVGGVAIGNAGSSNGGGTATAAQAPASTVTAPPSQPLTPGQPHAASTPSQSGQIPKGWTAGSGTVITGASADKAKAAAVDAGFKGKINRVLKLSDGSYAVHLIGTTGPHHVFVSTAFEVTGYATSG
jgi:hypothetical protein